MTERIIFNERIAERLAMKKTIQSFAVDRLDFEIMALDERLISIVRSGDSYEEMLFTAADNGLVYENRRMIDNKDISAEDIIDTWGDDDIKDIDCDPCIRARVGEKVCEISGLSEMLEEMLFLEAEVAKEEEEAKMIQVGDHEFPGSTPTDKLTEEALEQDAALYANEA